MCSLFLNTAFFLPIILKLSDPFSRRSLVGYKCSPSNVANDWFSNRVFQYLNVQCSTKYSAFCYFISTDYYKFFCKSQFYPWLYRSLKLKYSTSRALRPRQVPHQMFFAVYYKAPRKMFSLRPLFRRTLQHTLKARPAPMPRMGVQKLMSQPYIGPNPKARRLAVAVASATVGSALLMFSFSQEPKTAAAAALAAEQVTNRMNSMNVGKLYTLAEFKAMCEEDRIVVAYKGELFDVSSFSGHPGGVGRLKMASGHDLEKYWAVYTQHNRGHIQEVMAPYKIGRLSDEDMKIV